MSSLTLFGPRLKVERAEHHIRKLDALFGQYVRDSMKRFRPKRNRDPLKQARPATFPKHVPTVLGDALHNLHAALDHAYHIAADANSATFSERRLFPFGQDRQSLEGSINGHKAKGTTPSEEVITAILDEIQPYEGGKLGLYGLHKLDITDKHLVLIPTTSKVHIEQLDFVDERGAKTGGGISNLFMTADQGENFEFFNIGVGRAEMKGNPKDAFSICFGGGQPFEGERISDILKSLRLATIEAINIIGRAANLPG